MIIKRRKRLKGMSNKKIIDKILEEKNIQTVFQPVVSLKDGEILGYEALSRMDPADRRDGHGQGVPAGFPVPEAMGTGNIMP